MMFSFLMKIKHCILGGFIMNNEILDCLIRIIILTLGYMILLRILCRMRSNLNKEE